jgi:hypothetical protein
LAFIGIGSESSISSVDELKQAIETQNAIAQGKIEDPVKQVTPPARTSAPADVTKAAKLPTAEPEAAPNPVQVYLSNEREALRVMREIDAKTNNTIWNAQIKALREAKMIPAKALSAYTKAEAEDLVACMYANFEPLGTVLKNVGETA